MPLHVFQTFTYRLNPQLSAEAEIGARIMVPLGRKLVTGYIVGLSDEPPATLVETEIKEAQSLVDLVPVCSPEVLELARWVADYYASRRSYQSRIAAGHDARRAGEALSSNQNCNVSFA